MTGTKRTPPPIPAITDTMPIKKVTIKRIKLQIHQAGWDEFLPEVSELSSVSSLLNMSPSDSGEWEVSPGRENCVNRKMQNNAAGKYLLTIFLVNCGVQGHAYSIMPGNLPSTLTTARFNDG